MTRTLEYYESHVTISHKMGLWWLVHKSWEWDTEQWVFWTHTFPFSSKEDAQKYAKIWAMELEVSYRPPEEDFENDDEDDDDVCVEDLPGYFDYDDEEDL